MASIPLRILVAFAAAGVLSAAQADILHLRDGTRYQGEVIRQSGGELEFRIRLGGGSSTAVRRFPMSRVKSIEKRPLSDELPAPRAAESPEPAAAEQVDVAQMLREAFELLDDSDQAAALRAMQKAVSSASPTMLTELERRTRADRGRPLGELMAATRIAQAGSTRAQSGFDIRGATPYEMPALGVMLEGAQSAALREDVAGRSMAAWIAAPTAYTELTPDARTLVEKARRTAAIIAVRLRIDPRVRRAGPPRAALVKLRDDLTSLAMHISTLDGYTALTATATPEDDPTWIEAQRLTELAAEAAAAATQPAAPAPDEEPPATQPAGEDPPPAPDQPRSERPER